MTPAQLEEQLEFIQEIAREHADYTVEVTMTGGHSYVIWGNDLAGLESFCLMLARHHTMATINKSQTEQVFSLHVSMNQEAAVA